MNKWRLILWSWKMHSIKENPSVKLYNPNILLYFYFLQNYSEPDLRLLIQGIKIIFYNYDSSCLTNQDSQQTNDCLPDMVSKPQSMNTLPSRWEKQGMKLRPCELLFTALRERSKKTCGFEAAQAGCTFGESWFTLVCTLPISNTQILPKIQHDFWRNKI